MGSWFSYGEQLEQPVPFIEQTIIIRPPSPPILREPETVSESEEFIDNESLSRSLTPALVNDCKKCN